MTSGLTPTMLPDAAAVWRSALEDLSEHASPCRYLLPARWVALRTNAIAFCERFGAEAHRHGWTAPELFAVHPEHGTLRVDYCGVLMVVSEPARGVEAQRILFERLTGYRNKVGQQWGLPVWEFAKRGGSR
jgi:hypothetical protein